MTAPGKQNGGAGGLGWTGIRTEKYTKWSGELKGRDRIVRRMISEGVWHEIKNPGVIILIVLAWLFSVLLPVLMAGGGGLSLEMDPDTAMDIGGWTYGLDDSGRQGVDISYHMAIMNTSLAEYDLAGLSPTGTTVFSISGIPSGWSAFINQSTGPGGETKASLVVTPPPSAVMPATAVIEVKAKTEGRVDRFATTTTIVSDPFMTMFRAGMTVDIAEPVVKAKAGEPVRVEFNVTNTGTQDDTYNITITSKPTGWTLKAFVDGVEADILTRTYRDPQGRPYGGDVKIKYFRVEVAAGSSEPCAIELGTEKDSMSTSIISLMAMSGTDPFVYGTYTVTAELEDTKDLDLTGRILFDQIMGIEFLWALFLAAVVGSKMIATDLDEKSYNLYFSRPITKGDYLVGKFGTLASLLALVTMVPTLVAYGLLILLSDISDTYVWDHLWAWGSIVANSLVIILTFTTLSLAFSSLTSRRFYAAASIVVVYLATTIMGVIAVQAFSIDEGALISINQNFDTIGRTLFDLSEDLAIGFPWYYALIVQMALWAVCTLLVYTKVERTELSE